MSHDESNGSSGLGAEAPDYEDQNQGILRKVPVNKKRRRSRKPVMNSIKTNDIDVMGKDKYNDNDTDLKASGIVKDDGEENSPNRCSEARAKHGAESDVEDYVDWWRSLQGVPDLDSASLSSCDYDEMDEATFDIYRDLYVLDNDEFSDDEFIPPNPSLGPSKEKSEEDIIYPYGNLIPGKRECEICLEEGERRRYRKCCRICVCDECMKTYFVCQVENGIIRISCISDRCKQFAHVEEIMCRLPSSMKDRYYKYLIDANNDPHVKTCPRCSHIQHVSAEELKSRKKKLQAFGYLVCCPDCKLEWCFPCHAPWHQGIKCKDFCRGDKLVKSWAKEIHFGEKNAEKCPKCQIFIERNGGCDHMICEKCHTSFCYRCGERYIKIRFIGDHFGVYSPFGCKYRLLPDRPVLRKAIRGSVLGAKFLATVSLAGAVVGAGALFLALSPIWAPIYFGHRLHQKRQAKRRRKAFTCRVGRKAARSQRNDRGVDIDEIIAEDLARMMRAYLEGEAHNLPDLVGTAGKQVIQVSDSEMSSSESSTDSSLNSVLSHEDEVLNVRVEGQSGGSENVSVWIHPHDKERKKPPGQRSKVEVMVSADGKDEKEAGDSECTKEHITTAKLVKDHNDTETVVLHVTTSSKNSKKDNLVTTSEASVQNTSDVKDSSTQTMNVAIQVSENKKSSNGCFVKIFGKKATTVTDSEAETSTPHIDSPTAVTGVLANDITSHTDPHINPPDIEKNSVDAVEDKDERTKRKLQSLPDILKSSLEAEDLPSSGNDESLTSNEEKPEELEVDDCSVVAKETQETYL